MRTRSVLFAVLLLLPLKLHGSQPLARLLVGTSDGPYVSYSWGDYWQTLRHRLPLDARAFYCLGPRTFAGGPDGLYTSYDYGELWERVTSWEGGAVTALLTSFYFEHEPVILVGTRDGLHRSRDGGEEEWERLGGSLLGGTVHAMVWPGPTLFVATSRGLFRSADGGGEWQRLDNGLPAASVLSVEVSSYFGIEPVVFAGLEGGGLHRSRDGGESFEAVSDPSWESRSVRAIYWWRSSLFVGTDEGLFVSHDAGESWESASAELEGKRILSLSIPTPESPAGSEILVGTESGIFKSGDGATTWEEANRGMEPSAVYAFCSFPLPAEDFDPERRN